MVKTQLPGTTALRERYATAPDFAGFLARVTENAELWPAIYRRASVPEELLDRARRVSRVRHLLVLAADWCGDAVNSVPYFARLAEALPGLDLRVLDRDQHLDIMDAHLTGRSRSIPVVILLDGQFQELGWWGPRPKALQEWVIATGLSMPKETRYTEVRRWYARDRGLSLLGEIVGLMESVG